MISENRKFTVFKRLNVTPASFERNDRPKIVPEVFKPINGG